MHRTLAVLAMVATIGAVPVDAQQTWPSRVQPGTRVRVWLPDAHVQEKTPWKRQLLRATVLDTGGDSLRMNVPGTIGSVSVARADLRRLDVSLGTSRGASAIERAIGGAIVGAIGTALRNDPYGRKWPNYRRDWRAAEEGAKWGAAFGAVMGFALPTERWRRVRLR